MQEVTLTQTLSPSEGEMWRVLRKGEKRELV
jgi:hypothetical protein